MQRGVDYKYKWQNMKAKNCVNAKWDLLESSTTMSPPSLKYSHKSYTFPVTKRRISAARKKNGGSCENCNPGKLKTPFLKDDDVLLF